MGAVALRKMIQDIVYLNHSYRLHLVYVLLNATAPFFVIWHSFGKPVGNREVEMEKRQHKID
jgi:hypothetical protein